MMNGNAALLGLAIYFAALFLFGILWRNREGTRGRRPRIGARPAGSSKEDADKGHFAAFADLSAVTRELPDPLR